MWQNVAFVQTFNLNLAAFKSIFWSSSAHCKIKIFYVIAEESIFPSAIDVADAVSGENVSRKICKISSLQ